MSMSSNDMTPYQEYLKYVASGARSDLPDSGSNVSDTQSQTSEWQVNPEWLKNPTGLFDLTPNYRSSGSNLNPYGSITNRNQLRSLSGRLGLKAEDADRAALDVAQTHFNTSKGPYSEASSPSIIGDEIAKRLHAQAGMPYEGLTPEQTKSASDAAQNFQEQVKGKREASQDATDWSDSISAITPFLMAAHASWAAPLLRMAGPQAGSQVSSHYRPPAQISAQTPLQRLQQLYKGPKADGGSQSIERLRQLYNLANKG